MVNSYVKYIINSLAQEPSVWHEGEVGLVKIGTALFISTRSYNLEIATMRYPLEADEKSQLRSAIEAWREKP